MFVHCFACSCTHVHSLEARHNSPGWGCWNQLGHRVAGSSSSTATTFGVPGAKLWNSKKSPGMRVAYCRTCVVKTSMLGRSYSMKQEWATVRGPAADDRRGLGGTRFRFFLLPIVALPPWAHRPCSETTLRRPSVTVPTPQRLMRLYYTPSFLVGIELFSTRSNKNAWARARFHGCRLTSGASNFICSVIRFWLLIRAQNGLRAR